MISKNILPSNFTYQNQYDCVMDREEFCTLVDRWKSLLVDRGAKRGNSLGVSLVSVSPNHLALVLAAGELGLKLVLLDKPICMETVPATKAALFAPIDFHVIDEHLYENQAYMDMINRYCLDNIFEEEVDDHYDEYPYIHGGPSDVYLCGSTSGSTNGSKIVEFTQEDCYALAARNANVFQFTEQSKVCHTRNMHHVSCMLTFMLPSLMTSEDHYYYNIYNDADGLYEFMKRKSIDQVFFGSHFVVENMLQFAGVFDVTPKINLSGFTVPEEYIEYCQRYNVEFMSHYGSVDTGIPLLLNHVTKDSVYYKNWLGSPPDDYYKIFFDTMTMLTEVYGPWEGKRVMEDCLATDIDRTRWSYMGRLEKNVIEEVLRKVTGKDLTVIDDHIVFWEDCYFPSFRYHIHHLDKKTWTTETKINMHQLRYYLKNTT